MTTPVYIILRYEEERLLPFQQNANAGGILVVHITFHDCMDALIKAEAEATRLITEWEDDDEDEDGRFQLAPISQSYSAEARTRTGFIITDNGYPCERWEIVRLDQEQA